VKILYVIHDYLPRHQAGAEIYLGRLAGAMRDRGHEVAVFTTELDPGRPPFAMRERAHEGVPVYEVNHLRLFSDFGETWRNAEMEAQFEALLDRLRPDAVHLHHLLYHSLRYPALARRRGLPVLFTLHDYALLCPSLRGGQLFDLAGERCDAPAPARCGACLAGEAAAGPEPVIRALGWLSRLGGLAPGPLKTINRELRRRMPGAVARLGELGRRGGPRLKLGERELRARRTAVAAAVRKTDLFLAPSRHLRRRLIQAGVVPARRVRHHPYGFPLAGGRPPVRRAPRPGRLSVVFLGTLAPHKGADTLVRAVRRVDEPGLELAVYGNDLVAPAHVAELRRLCARDPRIRLAGPCEARDVPAVMARADLLVVPSRWEENSPLVVSEAHAAGLPVAAADLGGLRELLGSGRHGPLFAPEDDRGLAAILQDLLHHPEKLADLSERLPKPCSITRDSAGQLRILNKLIERHRSC